MMTKAKSKKNKHHLNTEKGDIILSEGSGEEGLMSSNEFEKYLEMYRKRSAHFLLFVFGFVMISACSLLILVNKVDQYRYSGWIAGAMIGSIVVTLIFMGIYAGTKLKELGVNCSQCDQVWRGLTDAEILMSTGKCPHCKARVIKDPITGAGTGVKFWVFVEERKGVE